MPKKRMMSKKNVDGLLAGLRELADYANGKDVPGLRITHRPKPVASQEVKKLRKSLGLTQDKFALVVGEGIAAVQSWEQGVRRPSGAASRLIRVLESHPELAVEMLGV